jgi:hypothetical protein
VARHRLSADLASRAACTGLASHSAEMVRPGGGPPSLTYIALCVRGVRSACRRTQLTRALTQRERDAICETYMRALSPLSARAICVGRGRLRDRLHTDTPRTRHSACANRQVPSRKSEEATHHSPGARVARVSPPHTHTRQSTDTPRIGLTFRLSAAVHRPQRRPAHNPRTTHTNTDGEACMRRTCHTLWCHRQVTDRALHTCTHPTGAHARSLVARTHGR